MKTRKKPNPERLREYRRRYRAKHLDRIKANQRAYKKANYAAMLAYNRQWRAKRKAQQQAANGTANVVRSVKYRTKLYGLLRRIELTGDVGLGVASVEAAGGVPIAGMIDVRNGRCFLTKQGQASVAAARAECAAQGRDRFAKNRDKCRAQRRESNRRFRRRHPDRDRAIFLRWRNKDLEKYRLLAHHHRRRKEARHRMARMSLAIFALQKLVAEKGGAA